MHREAKIFQLNYKDMMWILLEMWLNSQKLKNRKNNNLYNKSKISNQIK